MTPYFKGALAVIGIVVLGLLALVAFAGVGRAACDNDNYTVYSFQKCINDKDSRCFITPAMIEAYSRALADMDSRSCKAWNIEEDEVVVEAPRYNKPGSAPDEEPKGS